MTLSARLPWLDFRHAALALLALFLAFPAAAEESPSPQVAASPARDRKSVV